MLAPEFVGAGAFTSQLGTGPMTVPIPAHIVDDVFIMICQSSNQTVNLTTANGFAELSPTGSGQGTAGTAGANRLKVFWCRATSNAMSDPVVTGTANHTVAQIYNFRGCLIVGDPWEAAQGDSGTGVSSESIFSITTLGDERLIVFGLAVSDDADSSDFFSGWANANLVGLTEIGDGTVSLGTGGGIGVACGVKAVAGASGGTSVTFGAATNVNYCRFALIPEPDPPAPPPEELVPLSS